MMVLAGKVSGARESLSVFPEGPWIEFVLSISAQFGIHDYLCYYYRTPSVPLDDGSQEP